MDSDPSHSTLASIRNIGIIAHIDAGKTTTTERVLYYTGSIHRMGDVDKGNTTTDYLPEERERGITIVAAAITCRWKDAAGKPLTINIIDTPGHVDFTAEVERSLRVLDGAVVVFSAVRRRRRRKCETVWRQAAKYRVPRICFINKLDRIGAEFDRVFHEIEERLLESHPIAVQIPIGAGPEGTMGEFKGLIDLITMKALFYKTEDLGSTITEIEIPEDLRPGGRATLAREDAQRTPFPISTKCVHRSVHGPPRGSRLDRRPDRGRAAACDLDRPGFPPRSCAVRAFATSAFSACWTQSPLTCPARSTSPLSSGTTPKKGPRSPASPTLTSRFAGWCSRSPMTPMATSRSCGSTRAVSSRAAASITQAKIRKRSAHGFITSGADDSRADHRSDHAGDIAGIVGLKDSVTGDTRSAMEPTRSCSSGSRFPETVISMSIEPVKLGQDSKGKLARDPGRAALARKTRPSPSKVHEETEKARP